MKWHQASHMMILILIALAIAACGEIGSETAPQDRDTIESEAESSIDDTEFDTTPTAEASVPGEGDSSDQTEASGSVDLIEVSQPAFRLIVADGESGTISIVDTDSGEVSSVIETDAPFDAPTMFATSVDRRFAFAVLYDRDEVIAIDSGLWIDDHHDHVHYYVAPPEELARYPGGRPAHVVSHGLMTAIFFDDDGHYQVLSRDDLAARNVGRIVAADAPHHGAAVPWDEFRTIVTWFGEVDPDETTLPDEVVIHDVDGAVVEDGFPACPGLHGEAALSSMVAFACSDGILILEEHGDHFDGFKLDYPDSDGRSGTLLDIPGRDLLVGNYADDAFLVIDPVDREVSRLEIPEPFTAFAVTHHQGGKLLGMSASGTLWVIDIDTASRESVDAVTASYDVDADWTDPTPRLAAGSANRAYVSEPDSGQIHEIELDGLEVLQSYDLGGIPFHLVVVGEHE